MHERIKQLRKQLGLSQRKFGAALGISDTSISKIEAGINNPSERTLKLICSTYHVYYLWLTTGQGPMLEDDVMARIDRFAEMHSSIADAIFKARVRAYAALISDEDWITFRDMVDKIRQTKKE